MKQLTRVALIVAAALLASNGYAAKTPKLGIVEEAWKNALKTKDSRKAQAIFDEDIKTIDNQEKHLAETQVQSLAYAIVKIINKMSVLGFGGMDTKNQGRIKRALIFLEEALNTSEETFKTLAVNGSTATADGKILCYNIEKTLKEMKTLSNDKPITKQIKKKLNELITNEALNNDYPVIKQ